MTGIRWCMSGGFQEQGLCLFYWPNCSLPLCLLLFPFLFFHSMNERRARVCLRTNRVLIALPACIPSLSLKIIIIIIIIIIVIPGDRTLPLVLMATNLCWPPTTCQYLILMLETVNKWSLSDNRVNLTIGRLSWWFIKYNWISSYLFIIFVIVLSLFFRFPEKTALTNRTLNVINTYLYYSEIYLKISLQETLHVTLSALITLSLTTITFYVSSSMHTM